MGDVALTFLPVRISLALLRRKRGRVAQSVEQGIENPRVGGSIPSPATTLLLAIMMGVGGCGDRCEVLCQRTGDALASCRPDGMSWADVGARSRTNFVSSCRADWDRARQELSSGELSAALDVCDDTTDEVDQLSCEELISIYVDP